MAGKLRIGRGTGGIVTDPPSIIISAEYIMTTATDNIVDDPTVNIWLDKVRKLSADHTAKHFPNLDAPTIRAEWGRVYVKIVRDSSAFAFIAINDGQTKQMGSYKKGDIFRSATWRAPAKHARGNLFDDHGGMEHIGPYGPAYLR
jgi:hypothetical protein